MKSLTEEDETSSPAPQVLDDADYRALADFRRAIREFLAFSAEGASAHGLTSQQHQALLAIKAHDGSEAISIGELADILLIKNHSAIGLVSRLEKRGFTQRLESALDRRRALVQLTQSGVSALEAISIGNLGQLKRATRIIEGVLRATRKLAPRVASDVKG